jgi:DNA-binding NtrC family response regulator
VSNFTVLLVEDDILQRDMLATALKDEGLEVIECGTAEAAELVVATSGSELRALVTDNYLDGAMTGVELAHFARRKLPGLPLVIMSGREVPPLPPGSRFLQKPFQAAALLEVICRDE